MIPDCAVAAASVHIYLSAVFTWSGFVCNEDISLKDCMVKKKKKFQSNINHVLLL